MRGLRAVIVAAAVAVILGACTPVDAGTTPRTSVQNGIEQSDTLLARIVPADGPGCAGAVSIDGALAWAGEVGLADLENGIAITADTRFDIASVSKQFTGLTVLRLVESGALRLYDTVGQFIDGLPAWRSTVTVEHLLHHTSGISDYTGLLLDRGFDLDDTTRQADALDAIAQTGLASRPGSRFSYSNSNYVLLASIVEAVSDADFATVLDRETFGGAAMRLEPASTASDVARSYVGGTESRSGWLQVGDGSIVATASELAQWGSIYGQTGDPAVRGMTANAVDDGAGGQYGAGIGIDPAGTLGHSGAWVGFVTLFQVSPDRSTVTVLSCNSPDLHIDVLARGLSTIWS